MTRAAYEQLLVLLRHAVSDAPESEQVRRLSKGLVKALDTWLRMTQPNQQQARTDTPRPGGLASVNASLPSSPEQRDETSRTQGAD